MTVPSQHAAADSAIGYQYQTWYALWLLLQPRPDQPDAAISLELHDDVAWDVHGEPVELLGLKHHSTPKPLTDMSDDVWRSLRVWRDGGAALDAGGPRYLLVTTSASPGGSAAELLRQDKQRNVESAVLKLMSAARGSTNVVTEDVRTWFLNLSAADRRTFINKVVVVDGEKPIGDLDEAISVQLWWTLPRGHEQVFLALLWRWWERTALDLLQGKRQSISARQTQSFISDLRDRFSPDSLPTLIELSDVDATALHELLSSHVFVAQMDWVKYPLANVQRAIVDYYRAVEHSTRWLAEDLIGISELQVFEDNLRDEWGRLFDDMLDELDPSATEDEKVAAGKNLLRALLNSSEVNVRTRYNEPFFARGKRHEIAQQGTHGWHPNFAARIADLLSQSA